MTLDGARCDWEYGHGTEPCATSIRAAGFVTTAEVPVERGIAFGLVNDRAATLPTEGRVLRAERNGNDPASGMPQAAAEGRGRP